MLFLCHVDNIFQVSVIDWRRGVPPHVSSIIQQWDHHIELIVRDVGLMFDKIFLSKYKLDLLNKL